MSKIKGLNTKPELLLRKALWREGIRYRINVSKLYGKPDLVIRKHQLAIFIDSEFFHGYQWELKREKIKSNREYWLKKISRNMERDKEVNAHLEAAGWTVIRFWSEEVKKNLQGCVELIKTAIDEAKQKQIN